MKNLPICFALLFATLSGLQAQGTYTALNPLTTFGGFSDGSIRPGDQPWVNSLSYQRGISYNPVTGNLIFVDREAGGGGTNAITGAIYVLSGVDGSVLRTL